MEQLTPRVDVGYIHIAVIGKSLQSAQRELACVLAGVPLEDDYANLQKYVCVAIREIPK